MPSFDRDRNGIYAQIVYASKSTDVVDVMCNGRWLMRDGRLLTARRIGAARAGPGAGPAHRRFLGSREVSVLQKLVAVGGAVEQESYEVQVKARVPVETHVLGVMASDQVTVIRAAPLSPVRHLLVVRRSGAGAVSAIARTNSSTTRGT